MTKEQVQDLDHSKTKDSCRTRMKTYTKTAQSPPRALPSSGDFSCVSLFLKIQAKCDQHLEKLIAFARLCDQEPALQARLSAASSPQTIVEIASSAGFSISHSQLKQAAPDLSASYWPWSGKGFRFRAQFFKG